MPYFVFLCCFLYVKGSETRLYLMSANMHPGEPAK